MSRFFIPAAQITNSQATVYGPEFHHLRHVLRLQIGDSVTLRDDLDQEHRGTITHLAASEAIISISTTIKAPASHFSLTLAQGLLKGPKMDLVVEKTTELGVHQIIPFYSTFTIAQVPTDRQADRVTRWSRIAQNAAKQSGSRTPQINRPSSLIDLFAVIPTEATKVLFYEQEQSLSLKTFAQSHPHLTSLYIFVGPEGGFSIEETRIAREAGTFLVSLGTQTLRSETASIVAVALCHFFWGREEIPPLPVQRRMP